MRLFEKHRNGAIIDMDGEPERVASILMEWRMYQDMSYKPRVVGFVKAEEVETHESDSDGPSGK